MHLPKDLALMKGSRKNSLKLILTNKLSETNLTSPINVQKAILIPTGRPKGVIGFIFLRQSIEILKGGFSLVKKNYIDCC